MKIDVKVHWYIRHPKQIYITLEDVEDENKAIKIIKKIVDELTDG